MHRRTFLELIVGSGAALTASALMPEELHAETAQEPPPTPSPSRTTNAEGAEGCAWDRSFAPLVTDTLGASVW